MSLEKLREWVGRTQAVEDFAAPFPVRALSATFDENDPEPANGDPLPPLWHWLYFLDTAPQSKIGPDGHAERGDFLPPVPLPRRMWAGSRFAFDGEPLKVGEAIGRASKIKSVEPKSGSTGSMVFVTVEHTVSGARGPSFVEEHDIVYREAAKPGEKQREPKPAPTNATWTRKIVADPVLLFRFSALTFNGHRIHYDQPYVTGTEGYPGLIVHGPLMGMLQMEGASFQPRSDCQELRVPRFVAGLCRFRLLGAGERRIRRFDHDLDRRRQGGSCPAGKGHVPLSRYEIGVDSTRRF
jgi:3-methylfumaryl-CoA hydratase